MLFFVRIEYIKIIIYLYEIYIKDDIENEFRNDKEIIDNDFTNIHGHSKIFQNNILPISNTLTKLRASDLGGSSSFSGAENIKFGEVALNPPDFKKFENKLLKKRKIDDINDNKKSLKDISTEYEMNILRDRVQEAYKVVREKRKEKNYQNLNTASLYSMKNVNYNKIM